MLPTGTPKAASVVTSQCAGTSNSAEVVVGELGARQITVLHEAT
jgi:hypothetical protein